MAKTIQIPPHIAKQLNLTQPPRGDTTPNRSEAPRTDGKDKSKFQHGSDNFVFTSLINGGKGQSKVIGQG